MAKRKKSASRGRPKASPKVPPQYRIFVSHATADKWIARVLCEEFEAPEVGAAAFRDDRDIGGGESIPERIMDEIRACDEFVVLLTPESVVRDWVKVEIGMAAISRVRIVPLLYHVTAEQIPAVIRHLRGYDLNDLDQYLAELAERVRKK